MNIQAMMQQAQKLQKSMEEAKKQIDEKTYIGKSALITAEVKGSKLVSKITINNEKIENDDKELLEDMIMIAINDAMNQIDKEIEEKLGRYTKGMPGLF